MSEENEVQIQFNTEAVQEQAHVLDAILRILPYAAIAGGYLRDLLLGRPVTDMDIFVPYQPSEDALKLLDTLLGVEFLETFRREQHDLDGYEGEDTGRTHRMSVLFEGATPGGFTYDIIVVPDVSEYIDEFPDNISRVAYLSEGLRIYKDFAEGHAKKHIFYRIGAEAARVEKLKAKFPDYSFSYKAE